MSDCSPEKKMNGRGPVAVMSVVTLAVFGWMLWQGQNSSTETLERLTNQRLEAMEKVVHAPVDRSDNPIRHTEAIKTLQDRLDRHEDVEGHPFVVTKITAIEEKLIEVETQFRNLDRFIQLLWQRTYDEPLPNPPEK